MSFNVAMLEALQAEGLDLAACIRVLRAGEKRSDPTAAQRMRDMRARKKAGRVTRNVTHEPPNDNILTPVTEANASSTLEGKPSPKRHRLPVDWQPKPFTAGTCAEQVVQRWEPGRLERELSKFRDHHTAAGTKWENWQAAWSKWVNNSSDFERGRNVGTVGKSQAAYAMLNVDPDEPF